MKRRARVAGWAIVALALAACAPSRTSESEGATGGLPAPTASATGTAAETPPPGQRGCGAAGPRYLAFLASGTCHDVPSSRSASTWVARPLFPDAPEAVRNSACTYKWSPAATSSPAEAADIEALTALGAEHLTRSLDSTPTCEAAAVPSSSATLVPPPPASDGGDAAPTGVSGCDVCARVFGRGLFVILPADRLDLHTVVVTTASGKYITFDVNIPAGTQAFSVELPSAAQDSYNEGRVPLFRAPL